MNIKNYKIEQINYCINCDYNCESVCPIFNLTQNTSLTPKNKGIKALNSIKTFDFSDNQIFYACINCNHCKNYCPHKNDISEVLEYAKEKTITTSAASNEILNFEEKFYKDIDKVKFNKVKKKLFIKKLPDFLAFYNLGFRDETITELKDFFRKIKSSSSLNSQEIIVEDMSFIFIVKKLKAYLTNVKIPKITYNFEKKPDFNKILNSGLEISLPDLYKNLSKKLNNIE